MPQSTEVWKLVSDEFKSSWHFPHCLGAIDGKHIPIKKPVKSGSFYFNYKKFFSIVLMAVVNAKYEFIMADVGVNGRVSDGGVIYVTEFGRRLEEGTLNLPEPEPIVHNGRNMPYVFVADDAFAMSQNLMKPYGGALDENKQVFNYRLSRARRISENVFGIMSARFRVLQNTIQLDPEKATSVTLACCYLHNFLRKKSKRYMPAGIVDWEDSNQNLQPGEWRENRNGLAGLQMSRSRNSADVARGVRDSFRQYFCAEGRISWQDEHIV